MNRDEIKEFLPHREPMLLLDEVTVEGEKAIGKYTVKGDEFFLQGHFPGNPIVPGVIQCEMIARRVAARLQGQDPALYGAEQCKIQKSASAGRYGGYDRRADRAQGRLLLCQGET